MTHDRPHHETLLLQRTHQRMAARLGTATSRRMEPVRIARKERPRPPAIKCLSPARPNTRSTSRRALARLGGLSGLAQGGEQAMLAVGGGWHVERQSTCGVGRPGPWAGLLLRLHLSHMSSPARILLHSFARSGYASAMAA